MDTSKFVISEKQINLDSKLIPYDLWATKVHVLMLGKQKIIPKKVCTRLLVALKSLEDEYAQGKFAIDPQLGLHLTIESKIIGKTGDDGYFMHTARSRNDQVATAELLYLREEILAVFPKLLRLLKLLIEKAQQNIETVMSGYTHMQPAKPTTFGQWYLTYADMLFRSFDTLMYIYAKYDLCPLGAVESYGTSWPIDRKFSAKLLGFSGVWEVPQDAISSRGFFQLAILAALKDIGIVTSKIVADLLLFNTFEYGYVELGTSVAKQMSAATGSSIMPQKKNPDALELIRAAAAQLAGFENIVSNLLSGLPMGYNRDTREVKEYIELGLGKINEVLDVLSDVLANIKINKEKMLESVSENFSLAPELADYISQKYGLPYRKVYKVVGELVLGKKEEGKPLSALTNDELSRAAKKLGLSINLSKTDLDDALNPTKAIQRRLHIGGSAPTIMQRLIAARKKQLATKRGWIKRNQQIILKAKSKTEAAIDKFCKPTDFQL